MSNMSNQDAVRELGWFDLSDAPVSAGLYAWYLHPELRIGDLHDKALTLENVCQLAEQLRIPNLQVSADGHLSLQMEGWLDHIHLGHRQEEGITPHVDRVLSDEKT
jgi:hypothetical protein